MEITLVLANVPLLAWCLSGRPIPAWLRVTPVVTLVVLTLHIGIEGIRWHLAPAYVVAVLALVVWCYPVDASPGRWVAAIGIGCLAVAAVFATVLPVFAMPKPTGPHFVGTVTMHLIDHARAETQGESPSGCRELMVQVWYPADDGGPGRQYRMATEVAFPKDHLTLVRTHAVEGVPVANGQSRYPVILFSPSWIGRRNQNTVQAEELASQGFFVVGVDHTFGTDLTVFPDGRQARSILGEPLDYSSDSALAASVRVAEDQMRIRAKDVCFVMDEIERRDRLDPAGIFTGRIDMSRVGVFGHSFGGAVAAEVCRTDPRVRAGANFDGFVYGETLVSGCKKPFLILEIGTPCPTPAEISNATGSTRRELSFLADNIHGLRRGLQESGGAWFIVHGTSHMNFCDSPMYTPIKRLSHSGPIARNRAFEIINSALLTFFQINLNNLGDDRLAALPNTFHELKLEQFVRRVH